MVPSVVFSALNDAQTAVAISALVTAPPDTMTPPFVSRIFAWVADEISVAETAASGVAPETLSYVNKSFDKRYVIPFIAAHVGKLVGSFSRIQFSPASVLMKLCWLLMICCGDTVVLARRVCILSALI